MNEAAEKENDAQNLLLAFLAEISQALSSPQGLETFLADTKTIEKLDQLDKNNSSYASCYIANLYLDGSSPEGSPWLKIDPDKAYFYFKQAENRSPGSAAHELKLYWDTDGPFKEYGYLEHHSG